MNRGNILQLEYLAKVIEAATLISNEVLESIVDKDEIENAVVKDFLEYLYDEIIQSADRAKTIVIGG